jgi:hypothetical protein
MQTTPGPGFGSNERLGSTRALKALWGLLVVSCCAALVAFACVYVNVTLAREIAIANPTCSGWGPPDMIDQLHTTWLAWGAAGVLSWCCAFVAWIVASASTRGTRLATRTLLLLSTLALICLACSIGLFQMTGYTSCLG